MPAMGAQPHPIILSAKWGALDTSSCPTVNFSRKAYANDYYAFEQCRQRFRTTIQDCKLSEEYV